MVTICDSHSTDSRLLLKVALQAKVCIAFSEHLLVHRTVRAMARGAAFSDCFVFKHKRATLRGVTLSAGVVTAHQLRAAAEGG